ncbi:MAG: hypothetical protein Q9197_001348 [Variospora fuerteventurae]
MVVTSKVAPVQYPTAFMPNLGLSAAAIKGPNRAKALTADLFKRDEFNDAFYTLRRYPSCGIHGKKRSNMGEHGASDDTENGDKHEGSGIVGGEGPEEEGEEGGDKTSCGVDDNWVGPP